MQKSKTKNSAAYQAQKFQQAQQLQQTGRLDEAEKIYKKILHDIPDNPDCLHFLGLLFFQKGDLKNAETNFKKSITLVKNPTYLCNYALLASHLKDFQKAITLLLESIKLKPDYSEAWYNLGCIYSEIGELENSEEAYQHVIDHNKNHIKALFNLLCVQESLGKTEKAKSTINMIMMFKPSAPEQYYSLALAISRLNVPHSPELAIDYLRKAVSENPESIEAYRALATLYTERNSIDKAKEIYEIIIKKEPNFRQLNLEYAQCLNKSGEIDKATKIFDEILENDKDNLVALNGIATGYRLSGKFSEAEKIFEDIIKKDKNNINAYSGLSNCKKFSNEETKFIKKLEIIVKNKPHIAGYFALGKINDDLKIFDKAIDYYRKGNALKSRRINFNREQHKNKISLTIDIFNRDFIDRLQTFGDPSEKPVFILGAPRSGTTLIEQIISSHSKVYGAGELSYIKHIALGKYTASEKVKSYPKRFNGNVNEDISFVKKEAAIYLDKINQLTGDDKILRVTDKMPGNYQYLGYIFTMFPNAKVINTQRNPIDTCLSIYFQNFDSGHTYAFDLDDLASWYKEYVRLMSHWQSLFGERIFTANYDSVVNDTENTVRNIIGYCNLEWEEQCLSFYDSKRTVQTASNWQVKQPIYKSSYEKWKKYEKYIPELIEGLSDLP